MPAARISARSVKTSYHDKNKVSPKNPKAQLSPLSQAHAVPGPVLPTPKKRRSPNAFILFRSYMIANRLYPPQLKHQNNVSCYVAEQWRAAPDEVRSVFFNMAEDTKRHAEMCGHVAVPTKKKRTRTRKSPPSQPSKFSALQTPVCNSFNLPHNIATSPLAPQPVQPTSASPLDWSYEADGYRHNEVKLELSTCELPYKSDAAALEILDAAIQYEVDFLLPPEMGIPWPLDCSLGDNPTLQQPPSFGTFFFS